MNARLRRIYSDYQSVVEEFTGNPYVTVTPVQGDPPEEYVVEYRIKGLELDPASNRPRERSVHRARIYLHKDYPREKPKCVLETPIFHPNFGNYICIGDFWAAGETLTDIIIKIGQMIMYQDFNPKSPLNAVAARWAEQNARLLPIDNKDLYQPELELEIELEAVEEPAAADSDDLDIEFA
ncbi:MAG: ubiquitin-conjugating enzyme E2 [Armatimonadota bacterium]